MIIKLITIAVIVTFFGAGVAAYLIFDLSWQISFLFAALIIVTGPTVITPILRNIPLKSDISTILKWEGILIDPIGALVAVLMFEFISAGTGTEFTETALIEFGKIVLFGFTFGFTFAHALAFAIKKNVIPHYLLNVLTLATVLGVFVLADLFAHESGLLAVVVMGMVNDVKALILFATVVLIVRPLGVFVSSIGSSLKFNEKLFISWVGPRGIVAAGIASLFGIELSNQGVPGAEYITPLVFMIVLGTVLLNATTARLFAQLVGVFLKNSQGILIIGASTISRLIGSYLKKNNRHVVLVDSNGTNIKKAQELGLDAIQENVYSDDLINNIELSDIGYLMAMTGNTEVNLNAIEKFRKHFGENGSFRVVSSDEMYDPENNPKEGLFSQTDDYIKLTNLARKYPSIHEIELNSKEHYEGLIEISKTDSDIIPLFVKDEEGELRIIPSNSLEVEIEEGFMMVYLGKELETGDSEEKENIEKNIQEED